MSTFVTKRAKELGLVKVDSKQSIKLDVFDADIEQSLRKNSKCCAFARAAKRKPGVRAAYFFRTTAWLEYDRKIVRFMLPPSVQKEIVSFDRSRVMAPGTYQLSAPSGSTGMPAVQARSDKRPGRHQPASGAISRKVVHRTKFVRTLEEPTSLPEERAPKAAKAKTQQPDKRPMRKAA